MASIDSYQTSKGKLWRVRYRTPDHTQSMKRGFTTKRDAQHWLSSMEVAKANGEYVGVAAGKITVAQVADQWFDAQVQVKQTTRSNYKQALEKYVKPTWGNRQLGSITHGEVQAWITKLSRSLSPSSIRPPYGVLSSIFKYAVQDGRVSKNPCIGVKLPRMTRDKHGYLTHEQVNRLAAECGDYGDVVLFLSYTGLRFGEMAGLRVRSLNMLKRRVAVDEAVSDVRGKLVWDTPKNHERRSVPFPAFLSELLAQRCEGKARDDFVFTGPDGGVMRGNNFRMRFFNAAVARCTEADDTMPRVTPHDLRHTAASLAISARANVKSVQRMLGHKDATMTLNTYADLFDDDLDSVALALDAAHRKSL
ncbi:tyrosine-type recombinase/integrase [Arthrobacter sp. TMN-50]